LQKAKNNFLKVLFQSNTNGNFFYETNFAAVDIMGLSKRQRMFLSIKIRQKIFIDRKGVTMRKNYSFCNAFTNSSDQFGFEQNFV